MSDFYRDNGYEIISTNILESRLHTLRFVADLRGHDNGYVTMLDLHKNMFFEELILDPKILEIADEACCGRMIPVGSIFFFCKPGNPKDAGSIAHQDNYAAKAPYGAYFVVGVALDDAGPDNGSLVVYPGTHVLGDLPCEPSKNFEKDMAGNITKAYPIGNPCKIPDGYVPKQLEYKAGDIVLIHGHLVHSAPKNPSQDKWRRMFYMHYIKDGEPFWPGWNARRGLIDRP